MSLKKKKKESEMGKSPTNYFEKLHLDPIAPIILQIKNIYVVCEYMTN